MANPRKFSEKIAIQKQKQAEEKAAFDQIMNDVLAATRRNNHTTINKNQHLHINPTVGNYRAESLPDVNRIGVSPERNTIDLKGCLNDLGDMRNGRYPTRRHPSPNASPRSPHHHHISGGHHRSSYNEQRRGGSSPYSPVYLSPPMDTNWRRTNSDSALHQTGLMAEQMGGCSHLHQPGSPLSPTGPNSGASSPRRSTVHTVETTTNKTFTANSTLLPPNSTINNSANPNDILDPYPMVFASQNWDPGKTKMLTNQPNHNGLLSASLCNESRPKSCEVPGITIQPTPEDSSSSSSCSSNNNNIINENSVQHPSSSLSNTGSLPDLTTLHFPAPLPTPIDLDEQTLTPVTSLMRNTIITESVYPNNNSIENNPSPGSPFTCITSNSFSTNTTNTINNNSSKQNQSYSPSPSSPYGQQQNIFTQDTMSSSHIIANNNSENSIVLNSNPNHATNTTNIINNTNSKQNQSYSPSPSSPYGQQQNIFTQDTLSSHIIANNNSENSIVLNCNPNQNTNNNSETANIINSQNPTFHHYSTNEVSVSHHNPFNTNLLPASLPNDSRPKSTGGVPGITIETLEDSSNNIHHHQSHLHNSHLNHSHQHQHHQHPQHQHQPHNHNHSHSHSNHHQQHPSFANTGSLPDLTNLQYTTSLSPNTDLDQPSLSPITNTMANTILTDAYPNASPSPGSPYNCVSSTSFVNQTSTNYSTLPASSASFVQQQSSIFTQNTFDDLIDQNDFDFINYFEN